MHGLCRWIHPLALGTSHFIDGVEVKMLDANHCPGAAIILFQLKNGQAILHTGDFRACKAMQSYPELRKGSIHTLYLDTTYCNQRYRLVFWDFELLRIFMLTLLKEGVLYVLMQIPPAERGHKFCCSGNTGCT